MSKFRNARERIKRKVRKARIRSAAVLRGGERFMPNYSHAAAECNCEPTHEAWSVPAIRAARSGTAGQGIAATMGGVDRCLGCDATWPSKQYDDDRSAA